MSVRCPVCDLRLPDRRHAADHMAITAMVRSDPHGDWLDTHLPQWSDRSRTELAARLEDYLSEAEGEPDDDRKPQSSPVDPDGRSPANVPPVDADVLKRARELTAAMGADAIGPEPGGTAPDEGDDDGGDAE